MTKLLADFNPEKNACKGVFYRGRKNGYIDKNGNYVEQVRLVKLKRNSCAGCEKCLSLLDSFKEHIACGLRPIVDVEEGRMYELVITNISTDWETGYADDWDYEFVEIKDT